MDRIMFRPLFSPHRIRSFNCCKNFIRDVSTTSISLSSSASRGFINQKFVKSLEGKTSHFVLQRALKLLQDISDLTDLKKTSPQELLNEIKDEEKLLDQQLDELADDIAEEISRDGDEVITTVLLEVKAGVGGQEAMLFAREVFTIYMKLCSSNGWNFDIIEEVDSDLGGLLKSAIQVEGRHVYKMLRHEAGVHRVQRIPKTEKGGRIHTSTITVTVIPIKESDHNEEIPSKDLKINTVRAGGPGGQFVNKTETCVQIQHIPTGIRVECQEGRNQMNNKLLAMKKLKQLLWLRYKEKMMAEYEKTKKNQVFSADRSEKIRTYNFAQDRISDHRLGENINNIKAFMAGSEGLQQLNDRLERRHRKNIFDHWTNQK